MDADRECEWHFNACGKACPVTCQHPDPLNCTNTCVENCHATCPPGTKTFQIHVQNCQTKPLLLQTIIMLQIFFPWCYCIFSIFV